MMHFASRRYVAGIVLVAAPACIHNRGPSTQPPRCTGTGFVVDADSAIRALRTSYVYLNDKQVDWPLAVRLTRAAADSARTRAQLLGVIERLLDDLYDSHAIARANTLHSPRLVPSGLDLWAEWRDAKAIVTAVRPGYSAAAEGIRPGMEIVALNGIPIRSAAAARLGAAVRAPAPPDAVAWALLSALAGRHDSPRTLVVRDSSGAGREIALDRESPRVLDVPPKEPVVQYMRMSSGATSGPDIAYVRINALGDPATVSAFDSALADVRGTRGMLLDLRNTPEGGNTSVAEPILGRFIRSPEGYQRVAPRSGTPYTRVVEPRGPWTYTSPVVVLVGRWTGSMGEGMAIGFDGMHRGVVVGTRMAGLAGAVDDVRLPCSQLGIAFPTARLFHVDGTPRERWVPPVLVDLANESANGDAILERGTRELIARMR